MKRLPKDNSVDETWERCYREKNEVVISSMVVKMKKSQVEQVVAELSDPVDVDLLIERLHLLDKIEQAENELARGAGVDHETVRQRLNSWLT